jgi:alpha-beta hydrolase superfamily lysophospholipase
VADLRTFRASDGYEFYYRHFAAKDPRGRIVFVHGIRSHGGWYERSCQQLADAGFEVDFLDRRGAGLNTAHRGDCPSFRRLLDDIVEFIHQLRRTNPWLPITLAGISWGGKLACGIPYRAPGLVDRIALLCPGLCPKVTPPLMTRLAILRSRFRDPTKLFPIPLNEPELFTASPQWRQFIAEEIHGLDRATGRFLYSSKSFDIYLKRARKRITAPTLLMLAEHDQIIDNAATRQFHQWSSVIEYRGAHHTLEFESDCPFIKDLLEWVKET